MKDFCMSKLGHARSFRDLIIYQKAFGVASRIFDISKGFPKEETYSLTDQIRRASRSIGAQIAEAWGKRRYEKHFISKLTDADAEQLETQHWVETALSCLYIKEDQAAEFIRDLEEIGRMLNSMMTKAHQFCGELTSHVRESEATYFSTDH
jgi:four helix bundle protein